MSSRQRGYSLIEVLVCLGLMATLLVAAHDVWDEAVQVLGASGRAIHDPPVAPAVATLRADLQGSTGIGDHTSGWTRGALELSLPEGGTVTYRRRGERLDRIETAADGRVVTSRRVLRRVTGWQWQRVTPRLVEVRVGLSLAQDPVVAAARHAPEDQARREPHTVSLRVTTRGAGGGSW